MKKVLILSTNKSELINYLHKNSKGYKIVSVLTNNKNLTTNVSTEFISSRKFLFNKIRHYKPDVILILDYESEIPTQVLNNYLNKLIKLKLGEISKETLGVKLETLHETPICKLEFFKNYNTPSKDINEFFKSCEEEILLNFLS